MGHGTYTFAVHVHPGSRRPKVGGSHEGELVVRVRARAIDGAANAEVLTALAEAFGLRPSEVDLVRAGRSRKKLVAVVDSAAVRRRHHCLLLDSDEVTTAENADRGT